MWYYIFIYFWKGSKLFNHEIVVKASIFKLLASFMNINSIESFKIKNSIRISIICPHAVSPHHVNRIDNDGHGRVFREVNTVLIMIALNSESVISWIHNDENSCLVHQSKIEIFGVEIHWWYGPTQVCTDSISSHYQFSWVSWSWSTYWRKKFVDRLNKKKLTV